MSRGTELLERIDWVLDELGAFDGSARKWSLEADLSHSQVTMIRSRVRKAEKTGEEASIEELTLRKLALAAKVDPAWFITGQGSPDEHGSAIRRARDMFLEGVDDPKAARQWLERQAFRLGQEANARIILAAYEERYARHVAATSLPPDAPLEARVTAIGGMGATTETEETIKKRGPRTLPSKRRPSAKRK